jgi:hypothetical protein
MKRLCVAAIILACVASAAQSQGRVSAGYWTQAFIRVTDTAAGAAKLGNYGYQAGISILGAWVDARDRCEFSIWLKKDVNYMFVAGGDNDAQDVDVNILDSMTGKSLANEDREAPDAMVPFAPPADDYYTLRLTLAKARNNLPCICVVCVLREDGLKVPVKNLDDCANKVMNLFSETDKLLQKENKRLELRRARNQWAVYGAVLDPGKEISVTNLDMGATRRLLLAMGDKNSEDVDLFLLDANRKVLAEDTKTNSEAIIGYTPRPQDRYGVKMLNFKGRGPSVVMTGFFDVLQR